MKTMKTMKTIRQIGMLPVIATAILLTGCAKEEEEVPEEDESTEAAPAASWGDGEDPWSGQ